MLTTSIIASGMNIRVRSTAKQWLCQSQAIQIVSIACFIITIHQYFALSSFAFRPSHPASLCFCLIFLSFSFAKYSMWIDVAEHTPNRNDQNNWLHRKCTYQRHVMRSGFMLAHSIEIIFYLYVSFVININLFKSVLFMKCVGMFFCCSTILITNLVLLLSDGFKSAWMYWFGCGKYTHTNNCLAVVRLHYSDKNNDDNNDMMMEECTPMISFIDIM